MSDNFDKVIQAKQIEKLESENRRLAKKETTLPSNEDAVLRRLQSEMRNRPIQSPIELSTETLLGEKLDQKSIQRLSKQIAQEIREVDKLVPNFSTNEEINQHCEKAWDKLASSQEGKVLLREAGGKENLVKLMNGGIHKFINRSTYCSENTKELRADAIGRNVHRAAELFYLEKDPKKVLDGKILLEQRIGYVDPKGDRHIARVDNISRVSDGRLQIKDYKPINLGEYERTPQGKKWTEWARKTIGNDFRDKIRNGESPFFSYQTRGEMPADIRLDLRQYISGGLDEYKAQMEKYKFLVSEATDIELSKVGVSIHPYFRFK